MHCGAKGWATRHFVTINSKHELTEMNERYLRHTLSHLLLRLIAVVNLIEVGLELAYPPFGRAVANGPFAIFGDAWLVITSIALPVFVVLESTWLQEAGARRKAVLIDAFFAIAWFLVFWIGVLYAFTHTVWL